MPAPTVDSAKPPAEIGDCLYCQLKLYADQPIVLFPDGQISHVACETDARRQGDTYEPAWSKPSGLIPQVGTLSPLASAWRANWRTS